MYFCTKVKPLDMKAISFKNFKRFSEFPEMDIKDITILIGGNNSGKSSFRLAWDFILSALKGLSMRESLFGTFAEAALPLSLGDYTRIHRKGVNDPIQFSIKLGIHSETGLERFIINVLFTNGEDQDKSVFFDSISIIDTELHLASTITREHIRFEWIDYGNQSFVIDPNQNAIQNNPGFTQLDSILAVIQDEILKESKNTSYNDAESITNDWGKTYNELAILRSNRFNQYLQKFEKKYNGIKDFDMLTFDVLGFAHPSKFELTDLLFHYTFGWDFKDNQKWDEQYCLPKNIRARLHESAQDLEELLTLEVAPSLTAHSLEKSIVILPTHPLFELLKKFDYRTRKIGGLRNFLDRSSMTEEVNFRDYLHLFGICKDFKLQCIGGVAYTLELKNECDEWVHLSDMGTGSIRLIEIILFTVLSNPEETLFIEEPEQNLHPMLQSRLADFFSLATKKQKTKFIVETHSEYLVRRTQVLVSKLECTSEKQLEKSNPFAVYYFPVDGVPYDMKYHPNGHFENSFGPGFYDEAGKWTRELTRNNRR